MRGEHLCALLIACLVQGLAVSVKCQNCNRYGAANLGYLVGMHSTDAFCFPLSQAETKECPGNLWRLRFDDITYEGHAIVQVKVKNHLEVSCTCSMASYVM